MKFMGIGACSNNSNVNDKNEKVQDDRDGDDDIDDISTCKFMQNICTMGLN